MNLFYLTKFAERTITNMKKLFAYFLTCILVNCAYSQSTNYTTNSMIYSIVDRLELRNGKLNNALQTSFKPYNREDVVRLVEEITKNDGEKKSSFESKYILNDNREWVRTFEQVSKKQNKLKLWNYPADFFSIDEQDFTLKINPVLDLRGGMTLGDAQIDTIKSLRNRIQYTNGRGLEMRGRIGNKIGFYSRLIEYQERFPFYLNNYTDYYNAMQGGSRYVPFKRGGYDYRDSRGYITFSPIKQINIIFGQDKNFIGDGYRSLLLSDVSAPYTFLKFQTKVWKLNYTNLFTKFVSEYNVGRDQLIAIKYGAFHYLNINLNKRVNIGLFESVIFHRPHFDISYLNPIIFYRAVEHDLGSPDNVMLGGTFKVIPCRNYLVYGQLAVDDWKFFDLIKNTGWWGNRMGAQAGVKAVDFLSINNLDVQVEVNVVKPYTYAHYDSISNYSHYNQPLAHPYGSNFFETFAQVSYAVNQKVNVNWKLNYVHRGYSDVNNMGENIFTPINLGVAAYVPNFYNNSISQGFYQERIYTNQFILSYQPKHNLAFDLTALNQRITGNGRNYNKWYISLGTRLNIFEKNTMY
jgi:hypothetical protein